MSDNSLPPSRPLKSGNVNSFYYQVIDTTAMILNVDFKDTPIQNIINDIGFDLKIDYYMATPSEEAGIVTFKANNITFDHLLDKIFESSKGVL